ncbi:MAG TPA: glycerophosphodiester phosphodiesterase [Mycobacteriales bacterium]|nr:glycerophosphodiester phosphodiesterase [Mycobacteriales bacterium]
MRDGDTRSPLAIAHRAGNSLAGLRAAADVGADIIEADVHHYRGGLEVRHLKTMGPLPFLWDTWELVPAAAPRLGLTELLRVADAGATFMLDLKGRKAAVGVEVATLLHQEVPHRAIVVCSRYWPSLQPFANISWVRPVLSARSRAELALLREAVRARTAYGASVHRSLVTRDLVDELHESVDVVMTWPVNDRRALDSVLDAGVSGVISDETHVLREVISQR